MIEQNENPSKDIFHQQQAILDNIPDIAWLKDRESRFIAVNEAFGLACGMKPAELIGKTDFDIWPKNLARKYRDDDQEVMRTGKRKKVEEPLADQEKKARWIETIKTPIYNEKKEIIGTTGIARDITEHRLIEAEVASLKRQIEFILGATKTGLAIMDSKMNMVYSDPHTQEVYGDPAGKKCHAYFRDRKEICANCMTVLAAHTNKTIVSESVLEKENSRPVMVTSMPFKNDDGDLFVAKVVVDITEQKRLEKEKEQMYARLINTEKMVSLGHMAEGIAMEINAPLTAVTGYLELINEIVAQNSVQQKYLKLSMSDLEHARYLIKEFLLFAKPSVIDEKNSSAVNIERAVKTALKIIPLQRAEKLNVKLDIEPKLPVIKGDQDHIMQLFASLLSNAVDAITDTGEIGISVHYGKKMGHGRIEFKISDSGIGISKDNLSKVFEPFFTTKKHGSASGLGLAVAMRIIENHKGKMWIESELGKGTTVFLELPVN